MNRVGIAILREKNIFFQHQKSIRKAIRPRDLINAVFHGIPTEDYADRVGLLRWSFGGRIAHRRIGSRNVLRKVIQRVTVCIPSG